MNICRQKEAMVRRFTCKPNFGVTRPRRPDFSSRALGPIERKRAVLLIKAFGPFGTESPKNAFNFHLELERYRLGDHVTALADRTHDRPTAQSSRVPEKEFLKLVYNKLVRHFGAKLWSQWCSRYRFFLHLKHISWLGFPSRAYRARIRRLCQIAQEKFRLQFCAGVATVRHRVNR